MGDLPAFGRSPVRLLVSPRSIVAILDRTTIVAVVERRPRSDKAPPMEPPAAPPPSASVAAELPPAAVPPPPPRAAVNDTRARCLALLKELRALETATGYRLRKVAVAERVNADGGVTPASERWEFRAPAILLEGEEC